MSEDPDTWIEARFNPSNCRGPYAREFYNITLDPSASTGQIEFNGYFYMKQEELPTERYLSVYKQEQEHDDIMTREYTIEMGDGSPITFRETHTTNSPLPPHPHHSQGRV